MAKDDSKKEEPQGDKKFCTTCGEKILKQAEICPKCGVRQPNAHKPEAAKKKDPVIAIIAGIFIPGLGQIYTDQSFGKAALIFCTAIFILPWLYGIYDAYKEPKRINGEE